jgi:2-polyprenyl-3-methyl-5-hydroxy-6-metoxy-1,4-benzoquinol methylase
MPAPEQRKNLTGAELQAALAPSFDPALQACLLCGGRDLRPLLTDLRGCRIDACGKCGVAFLNPQYTDQHLADFYAGYINLHPGEQDTKKFRMRPEVRAAGKRRALQEVQRHAPGPRILLVGCGDGLELGIAKELGLQPQGYDVDERTTQQVARRHDVVVHCGSFHALPDKADPFDAVFLDQVIEHPKDPARYLQTCASLLRKGGVLYLGTPNLASFSNRLKTLADRLSLRRRKGRHFNTKHHLTFFTPKVLTRHLEQQLGLEVLLVRGSFKPQRNPLTAILGRLHPNFDSSFLAMARRPG